MSATWRVIPAHLYRVTSIQARHDFQTRYRDATGHPLPEELGRRWWPGSVAPAPQDPPAAARPTAGGITGEWAQLMTAVAGGPVLVERLDPATQPGRCTSCGASAGWCAQQRQTRDERCCMACTHAPARP